MEAGRAFGNRDDSRAPALSLGLTSVRLIVNKFESQHTRVVDRQLARYSNIDEVYDFPLERSRRQVINLNLSRWIPSVSFGNFGVLSVVIGLFAPKMLSYMVVYPFCRLVFGTLYPAYASYKAVRTKNLKEYVKWMMYWIVFALFTCTETITDVFLSWFPFYYEVKIVLVLWLLSPATKGSSILYRKFVHPALCRREQEIDEYIAKAKDQGYHTVLNLGTKGVNYATTVIMQTAIKGGGGLVQQIKKSYSLSDLTECDPREERSNDEADDVMTEPRLIRRVPKSGYPARRSASESASRSMYFPEVDVDVKPRPRSDEPDFSQIKSTEDISSGYSSADNSVSLTRTASLGARARRPARTQLTAIKRPQAAEESDVIIEEVRDDEFDYANMPSLVNLPAQIFMSQTNPPFLYQYIGDQVRIIQVLGEDPLVAINKNVQKDTENSVKADDKENYDDKAKDSKVISSKESLVAKETERDTIETFEEKVDKTVTNITFTETAEKNKETAIDSFVSKAVTECNSIVDKQISNEMSVQMNESVESIKVKVDSNKAYSKDETVAETNTEHNLEVVPNKIVEKISDEQPDQETIRLLDVKENTDNDSAESGDDEASFGTPENSPKSKRKLAKGKYGKGKAPPPPVIQNTFPKENINKSVLNMSDNTSQESLADILNRLPNTAFKESGVNKKCLQVINPIAENKRRHKSKSPGKIPKGNTTTISRLLQLPGKLAFWNKADDTNKSKTDLSVSDTDSRISSNIDQGMIDEFQSCADLTKIIPLDVEGTYQIPLTADTHEIADDQISFKDALFDSEDITQDIIDKSDALQKLIEAKIESHPEYKILSLHAEIPTSSKSTDV